MTEGQIFELTDRVIKMSEAERLRLDPICEALGHYQDDRPPYRGHVLPNRVAALAAVDAMQAWEKAEWEQAWKRD